MVVTGAVLDGVTGEPVPGAVIASGAATVATDPAGRFTVPLAATDTELRISADGYLDTTVAIERAATDAGPQPALEVLLFPGTFAETVDVVSPLPAPERPSATPIAAEEVFTVAGSIDNIFRTLDTLPGVASTGDFASRLAVRGGTPDQNLTVMDGVEIHNPYRLFGLVSAFNPETVERFELTAGGFGAAYGDRLSSLLVVDNRIGQRDFETSASASVTDTNAVLEGAAPGGGSWLLSGRRTYYDLLAGLVTDQNLPSFADVQVQAHWTLGPGHRLSNARASPAARTPTSASTTRMTPSPRDTGRLYSEAGNDLASLRLDAVLGNAATSRTIVSWYRNTDRLGVDATFESDARRSNTPDQRTAVGLTSFAFDRDLTVRDLSVRQELALQLSPAHTLDAGLELHRLASGVGLFITGDRNETVANPSSVRGGTGLPDTLDSTLGGTRGGAWIQDRYTRHAAALHRAGPARRLEHRQRRRRPLAAASRPPSRSAGRSRLRVAGGLYTQSPGYEKLILSDYFFDLSPEVVRTLRHERAIHLVTGFEKDLGAETLLRVEGYYKTFDDLIVGSLETEAARRARVDRYDFPADLRASVPDAARITSLPVNGGDGAAHGVDVYLVRSDASARLAGWLSYAWGRAEPRHLRLPLSVRVRPPARLQRRRPLPARGAAGASPPLRRWPPGSPTPRPSGCAWPRRRTQRPAGSSRRATPPGRSSTRWTSAVSTPCSAAACRTMPAWTCASPTSREDPSGRWSWYIEVINLLNRDNPVEFQTELAHDPGALTPRIVENPTAGFPILPSFGVRIRF